MLLRRLFDDKLAQASYLVACEHARAALVVDPNRDIAQYIAAAANDNLKIVAVTETHIHADFVSGARELAARTGARLYLSDAGGPDWKYGFANDPSVELLTDGSHFMVGDVRIDAVHTPGHTPEHMTFLLTDTATASQPMGALTGDFIFVGDVGRPDLLERAAGFAGTMEAGARQLFQSLQAFKGHPDYLQVWPGHGAGSACGKSLGAMPQSTLGYEKLFNWALAEPDEARFVAEVLAGQPEPPAYFAEMKRVNRDGPAPYRPKTPPEASAVEIAHAIESGGIVVDTRPTAEYGQFHAHGTISIPRNKAFLNWAGSLVPYDRDLWIIGDAASEARRAVALELSLIGLETIAGVLPATALESLSAHGVAMEALSTVSTAEASRSPHVQVLDVRGRSEVAAGHIRGSINIPLGELQRRMSEVPPGPLIVHCQGGSRSAIAASILERAGHEDVRNMPGGFSEWERTGNKVDRGLPTGGD